MKRSASFCDSAAAGEETQQSALASCDETSPAGKLTPAAKKKAAIRAEILKEFGGQYIPLDDSETADKPWLRKAEEKKKMLCQRLLSKPHMVTECLTLTEDGVIETLYEDENTTSKSPKMDKVEAMDPSNRTFGALIVEWFFHDLLQMYKGDADTLAKIEVLKTKKPKGAPAELVKVSVKQFWFLANSMSESYHVPSGIQDAQGLNQFMQAYREKGYAIPDQAKQWLQMDGSIPWADVGVGLWTVRVDGDLATALVHCASREELSLTPDYTLKIENNSLAGYSWNKNFDETKATLLREATGTTIRVWSHAPKFGEAKQKMLQSIWDEISGVDNKALPAAIPKQPERPKEAVRPPPPRGPPAKSPSALVSKSGPSTPPRPKPKSKAKAIKSSDTQGGESDEE